jgi:transcriptional regulator with XRE-family HTH domain
MEFGQYLREIRKSKELGIREVARRSGISQAYMSQIENSKRNVGAKTLYKIAKGLNVDYQTLIYKSLDIEKADENIQFETIERYEKAIKEALLDIKNLEVRSAVETLEKALREF